MHVNNFWKTKVHCTNQSHVYDRVGNNFLFVCLFGWKEKEKTTNETGQQPNRMVQQQRHGSGTVSEWEKIKMYPINSEGMVISIEKPTYLLCKLVEFIAIFFPYSLLI